MRLSDVRLTALRVGIVVTLTMASTPVSAQTRDVQIDMVHNTANEQSEAARLRGVLGRFNVMPWVLTDHILIDEKAIPHSHPVLTVVYGDHGDDNLLLSNFVHEQLHWWLVAHQRQTDAAIAELRRLFPGLPVGGLDGAQTDESSYLHLIVNYLEYQGDKVLLGDSKAAELMTFWKNDHYRVLYKTMLDSESVVRRVVEDHQLECCSSR